jgi:DNA-binding XRE family transcriptional regulator
LRRRLIFLKNNWLWDVKTSEEEAKKVLSQVNHPRFIPLAAKLLSRKNSAREVLQEYVSGRDFCQNWFKIKRAMRRDAWSNPNIEYWQAIYEKVVEKLKEKGIELRRRPVKGSWKEIGDKICTLRLKGGMTQKEFASKIGISQQMISRIERGRENLSLYSLKAVARSLEAKLKVDIVPLKSKSKKQK